MTSPKKQAAKPSARKAPAKPRARKTPAKQTPAAPKPKPKRASTLAGKPGPKKAPVKLRLLKSDNPHKNRVGEPDLAQDDALDLDALPLQPPQPLTTTEREFWDWIVKFQRAQKVPWLHAPDSEYIIKVAGFYARAKQIRFELNYHLSKNETLLMLDTDRPHPLLREEKQFVEAYLKGLREMAMLTPARQVTGEESPEDILGDFAM